MIQQSQLENQSKNSENVLTSSLNQSILVLEREVEELQMKANNLLQQKNQLKCISDEIQMLQLQSQEAYDTLRKMRTEYNQKYRFYCSKIDNRNEDIYDERDKIQSNLYYLEQQNRQLDEYCKQKIEERKRLVEEIESFTFKKEGLLQLQRQQSAEVARLIKSNKALEESIRITRQEYEILQEEIFEVDIKGQNLKKYGYDVVPQRILSLIERRDTMQKQLEQLQMKKEEQQKIFGEFVNLELSQYATQQFQQQKKRKKQLEELIQQNAELKQQNKKLNEIKNEYEWNPNLEIKQLELNLQQEEKKISAIQKQISNIKRKTKQATEKIKQYKQYSEFYENNDANQNVIASPAQQIDSPRKIKQIQSPRKGKQKGQRKEKIEKIKKPARTTIFEQLKNDLETRETKKLNWKDALMLRYGTSKQQIIAINDSTFKVKKSSQKFGVFLMSLLLFACVYYCSKTLKK